MKGRQDLSWDFLPGIDLCYTPVLGGLSAEAKGKVAWSMLELEEAGLWDRILAFQVRHLACQEHCGALWLLFPC